MGYRLIHKIAGKESGPGQFSEALRGIALDAGDHLYAVGDKCVHVFDAAGQFQRNWSTALPGQCIAVSTNGDVFVGQEQQVEIFNADGKLLDTWKDAERLGLVTAIGFAGDDVIIADAAARCLRRFDRKSAFRNDIGLLPGRRGFLIPNGTLDFAIDAAGVIHAANPGKHRIERYNLVGEKLGQIGRFGGQDPAGFGGCCNPTNVTVTPDGTIVVSEKAAPRAKSYSADGELRAIISDDAFDLNCKNMDIAVDSRGRVYVVDTVRLHICVFEPRDVTADNDQRPRDTATATGGDAP